jgi:hypothetical protein
MAIEKNIDINVNARGIENATKKVEALENTLGNIDSNNRSVTRSFQNSTSAVLENGGAMGLLNDLTGGVAMTFKDAVEASGLFGGSLGKLSTAWSGMGKAAKLAIASTGIGLLVVAVGALVAYWDDIEQAITGSNVEMQKQIDLSKQRVDLSQKDLDSISKTENILKLQGKTEREILEIKKAKTAQTIKDTIIYLENLKIQNDASEKAVLKNYNLAKDVTKFLLTATTIPVRIIAGAFDQILKAYNKITGSDVGLLSDKIDNITNTLSEKTAKLIFDKDKTKDEGDKVEAETASKLQDLKNQQAGFQLSINQIDKDALTKRNEEAKKLNEERLKAEKELQDKLLQIRKDAYAFEEDINKRNAENDKLAQEALDAETERIAGFNQAEVDAYIAKSDAILANEQLTLDERLAMNKIYLENALADVNINETEAQKIRERAVNNEKKLNKLKNKAIVGDAMNTFGQIASIAGEGSVLAKGFAVAQATMSGIEGVQNAFTTASKSPITTLFPAYPYVQAGLAGVFSALQIKKILTVDPKGGNASSVASSGGGGGGGAMSAPQFNIVGQSGTNQLAQSISEQQNRPVQAFVVGNEVTSQQALDRNRVNNATFG